MFNNYKNDNKLSIITFMNVLKYVKFRSNNENKNLKYEVLLDIIFDYEPNNLYRVSIEGVTQINEFLNLVHQRSNHILFLILLTQVEFTKNNKFVYIKKKKDINDIIDIDQFDIRIRKSSENILTDIDFKNLLNMNINLASKISFRYKNRISMDIINDDNQKLTIDLTTVQYSNNINNIANAAKGYEVELDYTIKNDKKNNKDIFNIINKEIETIKKIIDCTDILISKDETISVLDAYKKLVSINEITLSALYTMQPISAEVQHIVDKIPNFYSVTDKADGEKVQLFIHNKIVYIISNNLNVRKTKYSSELNNTILEGELIFMPLNNQENNKYIFMAFDCLFYTNIDIRDESKFKKRLEYINKVCKNINNDIYITKEYNEAFNLDSHDKFYRNEISNFYTNLAKQTKKIESNDIFFHPKFFLFPSGGSECEVYLYAYIIWDFYTKSKINYKLDGIIFTGLDQKYTRDKRDHKYPIYKYKPPVTNSIDVYINYQKNLETNSHLEIYDNVVGNNNNQVYKIINFYVGDSIGNKEVPVAFMKEEHNNEAYFPLINGEVRDQDGNYIQDNTVIEITYNNDSNIPHQYRWNILRTRWDKTEYVYKYQKKYGNFKDVAIKTWKSIKEAITIDEIKNMSIPATFVSQRKTLEQRLNTTIITTDRQQDVYYQKITNLCNKMRSYHNWIKSIIIFSYGGLTKGQRSSILDIGCGRGGDIQKWYHAKVGKYVGIDINSHGLYSSTDGAVARFKLFKAKFPNYGEVNWIHADGATLLESNNQENKLPNMTKENKQLIEKIFTPDKKFDCISSMFAIHYLFAARLSVDSLESNK